MTDFNILMDSTPLRECEQDINAQFGGIAQHANVMKLAVLSSFMLKGAMAIISTVNPHRFLESLKAELENEVAEAHKLSESQSSYMEHLEKNQELISNFESRKEEINRISQELDRLLKDYDNLLKDLAIERCQKSIAEIEASL